MGSGTGWCARDQAFRGTILIDRGRWGQRAGERGSYQLRGPRSAACMVRSCSSARSDFLRRPLDRLRHGEAITGRAADCTIHVFSLLQGAGGQESKVAATLPGMCIVGRYQGGKKKKRGVLVKYPIHKIFSLNQHHPASEVTSLPDKPAFNRANPKWDWRMFFFLSEQSKYEPRGLTVAGPRCCLQ